MRTAHLLSLIHIWFEKTGMPAILVEDDASGWYESGVVRNMIISRNTFIQCGEAVIQICLLYTSRCV